MTAHDHKLRPRHKQRTISFRSDRAAELLAKLTRGGRSQAEVIEEALAAMPTPAPRRSREERIARIDAIVARVKPQPGFTMAQFDAETYDENGLPR